METCPASKHNAPPLWVLCVAIGCWTCHVFGEQSWKFALQNVRRCVGSEIGEDGATVYHSRKTASWFNNSSVSPSPTHHRHTCKRWIYSNILDNFNEEVKYGLPKEQFTVAINMSVNPDSFTSPNPFHICNICQKVIRKKVGLSYVTMSLNVTF